MEEFVLFRLAGLTIWVPTLLLVIFRISGIFVAAPLFSTSSMPVVVKTMMAIVIGLAVTARIAIPVDLPLTWVNIVMAIASELMIGLSLGYTANLIFLGVETAGQHMGQQMGVALANVFDPQSRASTNVMSTTMHMIALAVFVVLGGHRLLMSALLESFQSIPLMGFSLQSNMLDAVVTLLTASFILGVKLSAPILIVLMLTSVAMGLIQRTMPQFNILSAGFQIRIITALIVIYVSLLALTPLLRQSWHITSKLLSDIFNLPPAL